MNNRKLVSILAITGIVANLGLATVFAQNDTSTGTETISCNTGGLTIDVQPTSVNFESKTTTFSTAAPLDTGVNLDVSATDTRGYDPSVGTCGVGKTLQIQSDGLDGAVATTTTLNLDLGTAIAGTDITCTSTCLPATVSDVATSSASTGAIASAKNIVVFSEAFSGTIRTRFSGDKLEVTAPGFSVPVDTYSGDIVFSLL